MRIYFLYVIFISLHELSHLLVAKKLGYLPKKMRLSIFGASLEGFDDFLCSDEIKIILAGPCFNFCVVVLCYLSFWFNPESFEYLNNLLTVNLAILMFNILPVFPLDMGRLMLSILTIKKDREKALKLTKTISFYFVVGLFFISLILFFLEFNLSLAFVTINLCVLLFSSSKGTSFKREIVFYKKINRLNKGLHQKVIYVNKDYPHSLLLKFIDSSNYYVFIFVDNSFNKVNIIDEKSLLKELGFI